MKRQRTARRFSAGAIACLASLCATASVARAEAVPTRPTPFAYGLFIGANHGGEGQAALRYAEDDAKKMATVLREVGRYGQTDMRVLSEPAPAEVYAALDVVGARLREHEKKGEQAVFVFYYSGHAKANAIHLGSKEVEIGVLRDRLRGMPSTLTLVVLDACQSGAFQRTKGAEPAADFSYNSVARLTTKGMAVIASSNAQELSQESDELKGSFFTHHFVVGLRGAGDIDRDGKVTLDEAYRYAYRRTLASTEKTRVGGQHVTMETDLSGQGEVALTFPAEAKSQLELPAALEGRVLVQQKGSGAIAAEVHKAGGAPVRLALASGEYEIVVRQSDAVSTCTSALVDDRVTSLDLKGCHTVSTNGRAKGEGEPDTIERPPSFLRRELDRWALELGAGLTAFGDDAYTERLREFGYTRGSGRFQERYSGAVLRYFGDHVALGADAVLQPVMRFKRRESSVDHDALSFSGILRGAYPFAIASNTKLEVFAQARVGVATATELVVTRANPGLEKSSEGLLLGGDVGFAAGARFASGFLNFGYDYAPTITNALGDERNVGGFHLLAGLRLRTR